MKLKFKYSKEKTYTLVYKDNGGHIQTTFYKKPTDRQSYLQSASEKCRTLKERKALILQKALVQQELVHMTKGYQHDNVRKQINMSSKH